ncbi:Pyrophosphate--fructose 6-phosphate 1-phosphotransferase [Streptomyces badius]
MERARGHVADLGLDAIIPIGGEGTLKAAHLLSEAGLPIVGVPKTIDNDIASTDVTFGFDTAVGVATEALDRLKTTAESHQRVLIVEVMGRPPAGSPCTPAWPPAPTRSWCPSAPSTSTS